MKASAYCFFHDPACAGQRTRARRAGGHRNRAAILPPTAPTRRLGTAADVTDLLAETINQVRRGELDPKVANSVGYLASVLLRAIEAGALEERLARLEAAVAPGEVLGLLDAKPESLDDGAAWLLERNEA